MTGDGEKIAYEGEALAEEKQAAINEKTDIENKLGEVNANITHINVALATAENDKNQYRERLEQLSLSAEQKLSLVSGYKDELLEVNKLLSEIEDKTDSLNNSKAGIAMKYGIRKDQLTAIEEKRAKIARDAENFAQRAKLLQDLERNMEGFGQSVKFVLDKGAAIPSPYSTATSL